ncbi:hypothetical protein ACFW16_16835 [Inquilinus sp. NPDC058860]|uniref:hypothetical protein n=1 Tax=Inquilinus sp. NPDC058860 TaxID=3346652 RepID=UPI0036BB0E4C
MLSDEYLEKIFHETLKREHSQEDDAVKTIGTPLTVLGLCVTTVGILKDQYGDVSYDWYSALFALIILVLFYCVVRSVIYIFKAIRPRAYDYLPAETEIIEYAQGEEYHLQHVEGMDETEAKAFMERHLRELYVRRMADAAMKNRKINALRLNSRTQALTWALWSLICSAVLVLGFIVYSAVINGIA